MSPSRLIFKARAGGDRPSSQIFRITSLDASDAPQALGVTTTGGDWLVVAPDKGAVPAGASQTITVQPVRGALAVGLYNGLFHQFGSIRPVENPCNLPLF